MKGKAFPVSMVLLWGTVFSQAMHSMTLGLCMGLLMGITFGLFDSGEGEKKKCIENRRRKYTRKRRITNEDSCIERKSQTG